MQSQLDSRTSAAIWTVLGIVTAPSFLFVWSQSRVQAHIPDQDGQTIGYIVGYAVFAYLALRAFRLARSFGARDFRWSHHSGRIFATFATIFGLEVATQFIWYSSDFVRGLADTVGFYEIPFAAGIFEYRLGVEEIVFVAVLVSTLPLAVRLLNAYVDFLAGWIAAWMTFFGSDGRAASPQSGAEAEDPAPAAFDPSVEAFERTAEAAIARAGLRGYVGLMGMVVTVVVSVVGFIYVFQSSATTRANALIADIEATPIAFSGTFFDVALDLKKIAERLEDDARGGVVVLPVGADLSDEDAPEFTDASGQTVAISDYLRNLITQLQRVGDVDGTLTAEGDEFLAKLEVLRSDLADTARTNWDIILVRTAIIVVALVAVKIFHSVMMAAAQERHTWENKLAAMRALRDGTLAPDKVEHYLAMQKQSAALRPKVNELDLMPVDMDKLAQKVAEIVAKRS